MRKYLKNWNETYQHTLSFFFHKMLQECLFSCIQQWTVIDQRFLIYCIFVSLTLVHRSLRLLLFAYACRSRKKLVRAKLPFNLFITGDAGFPYLPSEWGTGCCCRRCTFRSIATKLSTTATVDAAVIGRIPPEHWRGKCPSDYTTSRAKGLRHRRVSQSSFVPKPGAVLST